MHFYENRQSWKINDGEHMKGTLQRRLATKKSQGHTPNLCLWKIMMVVLLMMSIALKVYLLFLLAQSVSQKSSSEMGVDPAISFCSCELARRNFKEHLTFNPDTAHHQLVLSPDGKSVQHGSKTVNMPPPNAKRFNPLLSVLTREGFTSGKHCWKVNVGDGKYWAMGIATESVARKGRYNISPKEKIWAIQRWGIYRALTSPPLVLSLRNIPRMIWVYLDYEEEKVAFFNPMTKDVIFTFPKASFAGERVLPWFAVWAPGFSLTLLP